jgi:uncharacterized protein YkwD
MRHIGSSLCILLLTGSCTLAPVVPQPTRVPTATASASAYLHPLEKEIVREHNLARSQPRRYAGLLTELRKHYRDKIVERPNRPPFSTQEGIEAVDEAIVFLHRAPVLVPLDPSHGLSLSARDHVEDQGPKGETGHIGSDLSALRDRVGRYGSWRQIIAENIAYGPTTARDVVMGLIVDDGVADRGHRKAIFNPFLRVIGVHCGYHKVYDVMCVMNYAAGFIDTPSNQIAR